MRFGTARPSPEGWSAWARWPQTARSSAPFTTAAASSCSATRDPDPTAEHGWGFPLMNLLVDEIALDTGPDGTVVRLSKRRRA